MKSDWRAELRGIADKGTDFVTFSKRTINTEKEMIGVRVPALRKLAKKLGKEVASYEDGLMFLDEIDDKVYEEVLLGGLVINSANLTSDEKIELTKRYLEKVDSWAEIDIVVEAKPKKYQTEQYWDFAVENLRTGKEFFVRYGVIMMMSNFLIDEKLDQVFAELRRIKGDEYYVKMGMAWLYATAAIKYYDRVLVELESGEIDEWTRNKAYQKMLESYRITDTQKEEIRRLK